MLQRTRIRGWFLVALMAAVAVRPAGAADAPRKSQNVTINLINRLVERGLLSREDAIDLIQQAENDAAQAKAEADATHEALARLESTRPAATAVAATASAAGGALPTSATERSGTETAPNPQSASAAGDSDVVRVTYVPDIVKRQIRDEVTQEVLEKQREEHWATPRALPDWLSRYTFFGDFRLRAESLWYPSGNDNTGAFPNFNAINTGAPFDVTGSLFSPQVNVDQNRSRVRLRMRLGADVDMADNFSAGIRFGTGDSPSPVSTNQTLGASGGNFSKYALWLDRGFLKYDTKFGDTADVSFYGGRFDNPFFSTSLLFWDDLAFDGLAAKARMTLNDAVKPFLTVGAFPVFNTAFDFATNQPSKFRSYDKWLFAAQAGASVNLSRDVTLKGAATYYYFYDVEGRLSSPFTPISSSDNGDTDVTRPSFAQMGNTYFPLRDILPSPLNNYGTTNQWQYFGLATPFHELALTGRADFNHYEPFQLSLVGEFVDNLAFHKHRIARIAVNNLGPGGTGDFVGGGVGWNVFLRAGNAALERRGDWSISLGYRQVDSDATLDAIDDPDFGVGGTNLKGYTLIGSLALSHRTWISARWFSATNVAGPTFKNDTLQLDFNGSF